MTLPERALRRPVFAIVANLLILVAGIAALLSLPVRELPDVDTAEVTVSVTYEGAAPEVIDAQVTNLIEDAISSISGIRSISSESERGSNRTVIQFEANRDIDTAANDVRAAVGRIADELPEQAEQPEVEKNDNEDDPVMRLAMTSSTMSGAELTDYADRYIVDQLATIPGVASVDIDGERAYAMRIWLDRRRMAARGVTVDDVVVALEENNLELPAGRIETPSRQFQVRTNTRFSDAALFRELIVRDDGAGYPVRLGDVANVERGVEDDDSYFRSDFESAIGLGILRQAQSNTVAISDAVRTDVERIRQDLPEGTTLLIGSDDAVFIEGSIREVVTTLVLAVVLVVAVIFLFLASPRATLVPAVTIPIALVGACAGLWVFGFSINILTLFALILAIGLVVDDAIVVLENIQRRMDEGETALTASTKGSIQVVFAVIATSATLIAVFVPISFLEGQVGRLFSEFGLVLAVAVAVSTFVALTLTPVLAAWLLKPGVGETRFARGVSACLGALTEGYRRSLRLALGAPWLVLGIAAFVSASTVAIYERLPSELTPDEDRGVFFVNIDAPQGSNLEYTDDVVRRVESVLAPLLEDGRATNVISLVGRYGELRRAFVVVRLADWDEREEGQKAIIADVEPQLKAIVGADIRTGSPAGLGLRGSNSPVRVVVGGPDFDSVAEWSETLADGMREAPGLTDVEVDYDENQPGYVVSVDRERARSLGIEARAVSEALQAFFASAEVTEYNDRGRQYPVVVQARDSDRADPRDLSNVFLRASGGTLVPLDGLVMLDQVATPRALNRYDRLPSVEVSAGLAEGFDLGAGIERVRQIADEALPAGARISFEGEAREFLDTSSGVQVVFGLSILIVFLVLAAQFESFVHPVTILLTVPLGIAAALATILFTGQSLNIYNQVGIILLVGLMAKNGILIVEFANQLRDEGRDVREAIVEGSAVRLRPILMTVISTLLGAAPLVFSTGPGSESRAAIGAVIIGGFAVSSVLTLYVTPVLYDLFARFTGPTEASSRAVDDALRPAAHESARI